MKLRKTMLLGIAVIGFSLVIIYNSISHFTIEGLGSGSGIPKQSNTDLTVSIIPFIVGILMLLSGLFMVWRRD